MARAQAFKDRGVFIGFETKRVIPMRCRSSKKEELTYEALINNWAGDTHAFGVKTGDLVMSFIDVLDWADLSDRDKSLHAAISQYGYKTDGYIDPQVMRNLRHETDMAFGDPMTQMSAVKELRIENQDSQDTYYEILSIFSKKYGATIQNRELGFVNRNILIELSKQAPEDLQKLTREILVKAAASGEVTVEALTVRLDFYANFAAPVCSILNADKNDREVGYLSRQLGFLEGLMKELEAHKDIVGIETQAYIETIKLNGQKFIQYVLQEATKIKQLLMDDRSYTFDKAFDIFKKELNDHRRFIAFALDGWEQQHTDWFLIKDLGKQSIESYIERLFKTMPQPTVEIEEEKAAYDVDSVGSRRGTVKMMHSWDNNSEDLELQNRVTAGKIRNAGHFDSKYVENKTPSPDKKK